MKSKRILKSSLLLIALLITYLVSAQKRTHSFKVQREIAISADSIWQIVGEEFADVSKYHSGIVHSELTKNYEKSDVGVERVCNLDDKGEKYVKETLTVYDRENKTFTVKVNSSVGVPTLPEYTFATYKVIETSDSTCRLEIQQTYRTKPAFLGALAKGKFRKTTEEHLIFIEHYALTQEAVNKGNKTAIVDQYEVD